MVRLMRDGVEVAAMALDERAKLSAPEFLIEDQVQQSLHEAALRARPRVVYPARDVAADFSVLRARAVAERNSLIRRSSGISGFRLNAFVVPGVQLKAL
jgi:hypothetical protein